MSTLEKIRKLEKELAELKAGMSNHPRRWKPDVGERYSYVGSQGVKTAEWRSDNMDFTSLKRGVIYRTKKEAERADERRKLVHELWQEDVALLEPDWKDRDEVKYELIYIHLNDCFGLLKTNVKSAISDLPVFKEDCIDYLVDKYGDRLELLR